MIKYIGFDACETRRTFAGGAAHPKYDIRYPLQEWGWDRERCQLEIALEGLPVPIKSACFFCPAMKLPEIEDLKCSHPDLYDLAIFMETHYRSGKHFRGDDAFTISLKHKETGEKRKIETVAHDKKEARTIAKLQCNGQWKVVGVYPAVPGLGRQFAWSQRFGRKA